MNTIKITGSNIIFSPHKYLKAYECTSDKNLPPMKNGGFNTYYFTESVELTFENMPIVPRIKMGREEESENFKWYECAIIIKQPSGKTSIGDYYITFDKKKNVFFDEKVIF
jgi:hypothetical protein